MVKQIIFFCITLRLISQEDPYGSLSSIFLPTIIWFGHLYIFEGLIHNLRPPSVWFGITLLFEEVVPGFPPHCCVSNLRFCSSSRFSSSNGYCVLRWYTVNRGIRLSKEFLSRILAINVIIITLIFFNIGITINLSSSFLQST